MEILAISARPSLRTLVFHGQGHAARLFPENLTQPPSPPTSVGWRGGAAQPERANMIYETGPYPIIDMRVYLTPDMERWLVAASEYTDDRNPQQVMLHALWIGLRELSKLEKQGRRDSDNTASSD